MTVKITIQMDDEEAAALARLCDKFAFSDAAAYLYPHLPAATREAQAYCMVHATMQVLEALHEAGIRGYPWVAQGEGDL